MVFLFSPAPQIEASAEGEGSDVTADSGEGDDEQGTGGAAARSASLLYSLYFEPVVLPSPPDDPCRSSFVF